MLVRARLLHQFRWSNPCVDGRWQRRDQLEAADVSVHAPGAGKLYRPEPRGRIAGLWRRDSGGLLERHQRRNGRGVVCAEAFYLVRSESRHAGHTVGLRGLESDPALVLYPGWNM